MSNEAARLAALERRILQLERLTPPHVTSASSAAAVAAEASARAAADAVLDTDKADKSVVLTAGAGLSGGGDLSAARSFSVGAGDGVQVDADSVTVKLDGASLAKSAAGVKVSAIDDTMHGARAGGSLHADAVAGGAAGFLSGARAQKLDDFPVITTIGSGLSLSAGTLSATGGGSPGAWAAPDYASAPASNVWKAFPSAGYSGFTFLAARCRVKADGDVQLEGSIQRTTLASPASGETLFRLPSNSMYPTQAGERRFHVPCWGGSVSVHITGTDYGSGAGWVRIFDASGIPQNEIALDGITFTP